MKDYAIYLRKSRADLDAEARGEGETLERHRVALRALAQRRGLTVVREYAEVVTGDSIAARPQMQALLDDVKAGYYAGVIVNDVDRLGRGDSIDQEIIKYTFAAAHTIIVTPGRDIDPASPTDEDMLDFSMFFARFEYRKISQRLMQGRTRSAAAGNYISARVPFGYRKVVDGHSIKLEPDPDVAPIVRKMFEMYASGAKGYNGIATWLNDMGYVTYRGHAFERGTVKRILTNPVYTGRLFWGRTATVSAIEDGKRVKRRISGTPTIAEHSHPAIVDDATFDRVQAMFAASRHANPVNAAYALANPLAGLVYCAKCGKAMQLGDKRRGKRMLACRTYGCPTVGTDVNIVADAVLDVLGGWCAEYAAPTEPAKPRQDDQRAALERQAQTIQQQLTRAQELVELGVYTPSEYLARRATLLERLEAANKALDAEAAISTSDAIHAELPAIRRVLDAYTLTDSVEAQNELLKSVVARVEYGKDRQAVRGENPAELVSLTVYPRLEQADTL